MLGQLPRSRSVTPGRSHPLRALWMLIFGELKGRGRRKWDDCEAEHLDLHAVAYLGYHKGVKFSTTINAYMKWGQNMFSYGKKIFCGLRERGIAQSPLKTLLLQCLHGLKQE